MSEEKGVHKTFARSCERELGEQAGGRTTQAKKQTSMEVAESSPGECARDLMRPIRK